MSDESFADLFQAKTVSRPTMKPGDRIEATVVGILGGIASIEELRIPARGFSGMGLRLLDVEKKIWSDHWVNAKSGVVAVPENDVLETRRPSGS